MNQVTNNERVSDNSYQKRLGLTTNKDHSPLII